MIIYIPFIFRYDLDGDERIIVIGAYFNKKEAFRKLSKAVQKCNQHDGWVVKEVDLV